LAWWSWEKKNTDEFAKVLCGTKVDLKREVEYEEGKQIAEELNITHFFETSAKTSYNVKEMFETLTRDMLKIRAPNATPVSTSNIVINTWKKKKKKVFKSAKKNKHQNKKVALRYLKYYEIKKDGTVTRLRKECKHQECGPGVFMASHFLRQYCGKCGLTFIFQKEGDKKGTNSKTVKKNETGDEVPVKKEEKVVETTTPETKKGGKGKGKN